MSQPTYPIRFVAAHQNGDLVSIGRSNRQVSSATAARRVAREMGYRVMLKGGMTELVHIDDALTQQAWMVTVHP
jgi:precorrin-6x reductase